MAPTALNWSTHYFAQQLTIQAEQSEDAQVKGLLGQLSPLGQPAIGPLTAAAASRRSEVALVARQILDETLATWEQTLLADTRRPASRQVQVAAIELAKALHAHIHDFGPAGKQWAEQITMRLVDVANRLPGRSTRALLDDCSQILAAIPPRGPRLRTVAPSINSAEPRLTSAEPRLNSVEPRIETLTRASESALDQRAPLPPKTLPASASRLKLVPLASEALSTDNPLRTRAQPSPQSPSTEPPLDALSRLDNTPVQRAPTTSGVRVIDVPSPEEMAAQIETLRRLSSPQLFARLPQARFYEANMIRFLLKERGYSETQLSLQTKLTSPEVQARLQLIEDSAQLPATTTRKMLKQLLSDEHAEVRLRALTALATTQTPDLKALAHGLSVNDEDPRVAELASRLLRELR
jgi:hypothetical protein